jgi:hypothetical protein
MLNSVGQCFSILASFVFPSVEGPRYVKGIALNIGFGVLGLAIALGMTVYYGARSLLDVRALLKSAAGRENARRDRVEGGRPPPGEVLNVVEEHDQAKGFRYML